MRRVIVCLLAVMGQVCGSDFEELLGKGTPQWEHVRTAEDRKLVSFYRRLFNKNMGKTLQEDGGIPKQIHVVWLGPQPFPEGAKERVEKWKELNPDWVVNFWSDVSRGAPCNGMVSRRVLELDMEGVGPVFDCVDHYKEKAFLVAMAILHSEGGVYLEHDVVLEGGLGFMRDFDFVGTLAPLRPTVNSSSVTLSSHVIGGIAGHPFFGHVMYWYKKKGLRYQKLFPGEESLYRTQVRIYEALYFGAQKGLIRSGYRDTVFPHQLMQSTAFHLEEASWRKKGKEVDQQFKEKCDEIKEQVPIALILMSLSSVMTLGVGMTLWRRR